MSRHHFAAGIIALLASTAAAEAGDSATIIESGANNYASMVIRHVGGTMRMTTTLRAGATGMVSTRFTVSSGGGGGRGPNAAVLAQQGAGNAATAVQQGNGNVAGVWQAGWVNRAHILQQGNARRGWIYQTGSANFANLAETGG